MGQDSIELRRLMTVGEEIVPLIIEAEREGHRFMHRLRDEWGPDQNRFQSEGEVLLGAYIGGRLLAVGGLNKDPYADAEGVGRLRHVYVASFARRLGVGTFLVKHIIGEAARAFSVLRLRTTTRAAALFYEQLGFMTTDEETATHAWSLFLRMRSASLARCLRLTRRQVGRKPLFQM